VSSTNNIAGVEQGSTPLPFPHTVEYPSAHLTLPIHQHDCSLCTAEASRYAKEVEDRLTHEVKIAAMLQRTLFPDLVSRVDGLAISVAYQAGDSEAEVGGDFYDVFEVTPSKVAVVLGDVCGKGLAAAAQVSMVRIMLRYALYRCEEPARALSELNAVVIDRKLLTDFVTLFVAVYDTSSSTLEYASCGHEPALIVRPGSPVTIELLLPTGPIMGVDIDAAIGSSTRRFGEGDSIIAFSDGLVECGPQRCELLGVARTIYAIRDLDHGYTADDIARKIYDAARGRAGEFADDICLLVGQALIEKKN